MKSRSLLHIVLLLLFLLSSIPALAQESPRGGSRYSPAIAADASGGFVITWEDRRNRDGSDIYAQRYSSDGKPLGNNFKVNDDDRNAGQWSPAVTIDESGNFVMTWYDERNRDGDIYAQRYSSDGKPLGNNFKVNDEEGSASQLSLAITSDEGGNFLITWEDYRDGDFHIYAQRYGSDGTALESNFKVGDDEGSASQFYPSVAINGNGNFVFSWHDQRNGDWNIYAQRISSDGQVLGSNFQVTDEIAGAQQWLLPILNNRMGKFVVLTAEKRNTGWDVYAQRHEIDGGALGTKFKINDADGSASQYSLAIAGRRSGDFVMAWEDFGRGGSNIFAQLYLSDETAPGNNFKVNDDQGDTEKYSPAIAVDGSGNFVITWSDRRISDMFTDVFAQRFSSDGTAIGTNFKVNNDE